LTLIKQVIQVIQNVIFFKCYLIIYFNYFFLIYNLLFVEFLTDNPLVKLNIINNIENYTVEDIEDIDGLFYRKID